MSRKMSRKDKAGWAKVLGTACAPIVTWGAAQAPMDVGALVVVIFTTIGAAAGAYSLWKQEPKGAGTLQPPP